MSAVAFRVRSVLRRRWKSAVAVTIVVAATGCLALTLTAGTVRTLTAPERYVQSAALSVDTGIEQFEGLPRTDEVRALPAVASAASITFMFGGLAPADDRGTAAGDEVDMFDLLDGLVFAGTPDALGARVIDGRPADPVQPGEFVASSSFAQNTGATVGDRFRLITISADQAAAAGFDVAEPEGPTFDATLVGLFEGSATLQDDYPLSIFPSTILDGNDIGVSSSQMAVELAAGVTVDDLRAQLDSLARGDTFAITPLEIVPDPVRAAVRTQGVGLLVLAVIVSVATIVVCGQLLGREVQLPDAQRSALRTLGMTHDQLKVEALATAAVPVVAGVIAAGIAAVALSGLFPAGFARQVEPEAGARFEPIAHLIGPVVLALALLSWLGVGLVGRSRGRRHESPGRADLASRVHPPQAATALRFAFGRSGANAGSPLVQTAGLVVVLSLAVGAVTFGANVARLLDEPARHGSGELGLGAGGEIPQEVRDRLAADPDVEEFTMFAAIIVSAGSESFDIAGAMPVVGEFKPTVLEGRAPVAENEIALGRVEARRLGVGVGDDLDVRGTDGVRTLSVTGLAVIPGVDGGEGLGEDGYMTLDGVRTLDSAAPQSAGRLRLRADAPEGTAARLSQLVAMGIGPIDPPGEIINLGRVRSLPLVLVAVLGALVVLSLGHQLIQSGRRRRRDMAILRALGATRGWVTAVMHWQATLLTLLVFAIAGPVGFIAGRRTYRVVADRIGAQTDVFVPLLSLAAVLMALLVAANLAAAMSSLRARRLPPAGYLNQE